MACTAQVLVAVLALAAVLAAVLALAAVLVKALLIAPPPQATVFATIGGGIAMVVVAVLAVVVAAAATIRAVATRARVMHADVAVLSAAGRASQGNHSAR